MSDDFHTTYAAGTPDPYLAKEALGRGGSSWVDKVTKKNDESRFYARKAIFLSPRMRTPEYILKIKTEARIIRRLHHRHIVEVVSTHQLGNTFNIIMLPVAEKNLAELLHEVDHMNEGQEKVTHLEQMQKWPGCLIRATDYMHEMRVKHKDIKPSNILVKGDEIYITDFGIAKDLTNEPTTASDGTVGPHTPNYCSPEVATSGARRGRATDIFSLGCIFLEMCTVMIGPAKSLERFRDFRAKGPESHPYAGNANKILQWICYLSSHLASRAREGLDSSKFLHGAALPGLAFVMLDPDPKKRITARQLVALMTSFPVTNDMACDRCRSMVPLNDGNLPFHSRWKRGAQLNYPTDPEEALMSVVASDWEAAKILWLEDHMWW